METLLTYRGRKVSTEDGAFIKDLIAANPAMTRRALSLEVCRSWRWEQENGVPKDMVCRGMLLALHRAGHIELPPARACGLTKPAYLRHAPKSVEVDSTPLQCGFGALSPLTFHQVRRTEREPLFNHLIEAHHYLGYTQPVGEHLKYLVYSGDRPVACFAWSSAPRHLGPRDRYIGWDAETRRQNIRFVVYNPRYLILPWVGVPHLASHLLGRMARMLPGEWERVYGHPVYYAETFVDPTRFKGTCYLAANWIPLGQTTGRGKDDQTNRPNRSLKAVLGYPLVKRFRARLRGER